MTPYRALHPDDVTILFLDYDVILFDGVNPIVTSLCPCAPVPKKVILVFLHYDVILFDDVNS